MPYVRVEIISPDGRQFSAEIDEEIDSKRLLEALVQKLGLPDREYELALVNTLRLHDGATVEIREREPRELFRLLD